MRWRGVVVAGLVLVAGCNAVLGGESAPEPVETLTPVPVDAPRTTTEPTAPPGVSTNDSVDLDALLAAHRAYLADRGNSYTWVARSELEIDGRNVTGRKYTRRLEIDGDAFLVEQVEKTSPRRVTLYVPNRTGYLRTVDDGRADFETIEDPWPHTQYVFVDDLVRRFINENSVSVRAIERNGETLYRVHTTQPGRELGSLSFRQTVTNYTATAYVTPGGFVRSMIVDYDRTEDGLDRHTRVRFDYSAVGETTVTRPAWMDQAPRETATAAPGSTPGPTTTPTTTPAPTTTTTPTTTPTTTEPATPANATTG